MTRLTEYSRGPLTFDVIDTGPEDGEPVVLLHGFPQRATSWGPVSAHLNAAGLRTYALDQRGYAPRARPSSRFAYAMSELVEDVRALIDQIGQPVHLVGHDWGAMVAWSVAGAHRDLVRTLTAVSVPHPAAFTRSMVTSSQGLKSFYMALFQLPWLPELVLSRPSTAARFLRGAGMSRAMLETYLTEVVADGALRGGLGYYRSLPRTMRHGPGRIHVPTTYVWSDGDVALGRKGAETCGDWVRADYRFEIIEGASHWLPDETPDRLAQIIQSRVND